MSQRRILVIENEPAILNLLEGAFSKFGYSIFLATNAHEAFDHILQESFHLPEYLWSRYNI